LRQIFRDLEYMTGDLSTEIGGTNAARKGGGIGRIPAGAITSLQNEALFLFAPTSRIPSLGRS
jgi:hypothetical protein